MAARAPGPIAPPRTAVSPAQSAAARPDFASTDRRQPGPIGRAPGSLSPPWIAISPAQRQHGTVCRASACLRPFGNFDSLTCDFNTISHTCPRAIYYQMVNSSFA